MSAVMIELRRDQYLITPRTTETAKVETIARMFATLVDHRTPKVAAD
nr:hypothetical protein JVH1_9300 [Rhodococcus sp. JVH1]